MTFYAIYMPGVRFWNTCSQFSGGITRVQKILSLFLIKSPSTAQEGSVRYRTPYVIPAYTFFCNPRQPLLCILRQMNVA